MWKMNWNKIELEDHLETDSDDSEAILVRKKRRIAVTESDLEDEDKSSVDGDVWSNITESDQWRAKNRSKKALPGLKKLKIIRQEQVSI